MIQNAISTLKFLLEHNAAPQRSVIEEIGMLSFVTDSSDAKAQELMSRWLKYDEPSKAYNAEALELMLRWFTAGAPVLFHKAEALEVVLRWVLS